MSHANSTKAIFYAFAANLGIAIAKSGAALWTGSGSLLAEAIHSFADCGNQVLLFIGMKRSAKTATRKHPMGFERESYIWAMVVAFTLFSVGGLFSIYEGYLRIVEPHEVENATIALVILVIAVGLESISLKGALAALREEQGERSLWRWFRETASSELMVVVGEDLAALAGLIVALLTLGLTVLTGNTFFDALGSIVIGVLLVIVAVLVGKEVYSLLIGESAEEIREAVETYLLKQSVVQRVMNVWAINHGSSVMLAIKAELQEDLTVKQAAGLINQMEQTIKLNNPRVKWIFFEIDDQV